MKKKTISFGVSASLLTAGALFAASCEQPREKPNINTRPVSPKNPTDPTTPPTVPNTRADMGAATKPTTPPKVDEKPNIKINTRPIKPIRINTRPVQPRLKDTKHVPEKLKAIEPIRVNTQHVTGKPKPNTAPAPSLKKKTDTP